MSSDDARAVSAAGTALHVVSRPAELGLRRVVMALGVFDGVHVGHRAIVRALLSQASELDAEAAVLFFEPHPRAVLGDGSDAPKRLCRPSERLALLSSLGIRHFVSFPFTRETAGLSPSAFTDRYFRVPGMRVAGCCVGWNWRFGCGNSGGPAELAELTGADVRVVPAVLSPDGEPVSSTRIRAALSAGRVDEASRMLGRPSRLSGSVSHGQHLGGPVLSVPTANVSDGGVCLPAFGVYAARGVSVETGVSRDGIVYIGDAPTLRGGSVCVELHLFDFDGDLYGQRLDVELVGFIRGSRRFSDASALREQIGRDIETARWLLSGAREEERG